MRSDSAWTNREIQFVPHERTTDENWDAFFDELPCHYWDRPGLIRRLLEPSISSSNRTIHVSNLPWWMPAWWARRTVANIAAKNGVPGSAYYVVERAVWL